MSFDVLIAFSRQDTAAADKICEALEVAGIRCWMAHRDVRVGRDYPEAIVEGVDRCRAVLLIFSAHTKAPNGDVLERATERGVPVVWLMLDHATPPAEFTEFRESAVRIDASAPPLESHLSTLPNLIKSLLRPEPSLDFSDHFTMKDGASELSEKFLPRLEESHGSFEDRRGGYSLDELALLHGRAAPQTVGLTLNSLIAASSASAKAPVEAALARAYVPPASQPPLASPADHGAPPPPQSASRSRRSAGRNAALVLIGLALLGAAGAAFGRQIIGLADAIAEYLRHLTLGANEPSGTPLLASALSGTVPPPLTPPQPELVDVSAFAPKSARDGEEVLVQVFLHTVDQAKLVRARARAADETTARRDVTTLATHVCRGQLVTVILDAQGVSVDDPTQQIEWTGQPQACRFLLTLPASKHDSEHIVRIRVLVDSVPRGKLAFKIPASTGTRPASSRGEIVGTAIDYKRVFLSYASPDLAKVLQCAQVLKSAGLTYFQDLLELKPREKWQPRLFDEIDRCQLFLLFWSSHAAKSEWVIREAEYALAQQTKSRPAEVPEIAPVILEGPPVPPPPDSLKHIHFNDPIRYVISAVEAAQHRAS